MECAGTISVCWEKPTAGLVFSIPAWGWFRSEQRTDPAVFTLKITTTFLHELERRTISRDQERQLYGPDGAWPMTRSRRTSLRDNCPLTLTMLDLHSMVLARG